MDYLLRDIRSWWEVPSIAHFCYVFRAAFNLPDFDIEEFEEALLLDGCDSNNVLLQKLIIKFLQGCMEHQQIHEENYEKFLVELLKRNYYEKEGVSLSNFVFKTLPLRTKVDVIHSLCHYRLDAPNITDLTKDIDSDSLRLEPLGMDESKATYWYFYGTRLYKEDSRNCPNSYLTPRKRLKTLKENFKSNGKSIGKNSFQLHSVLPKNVTGWNVVCTTEEDWRKFANVFKGSSSCAEKLLYNTIIYDFLPEIGRLIIEKQRNAKKHMITFAPRRVSSRLKKKQQQIPTLNGNANITNCNPSKPTTDKELEKKLKSREESNAFASSMENPMKS